MAALAAVTTGVSIALGVAIATRLYRHGLLAPALPPVVAHELPLWALTGGACAAGVMALAVLTLDTPARGGSR